MTKKTILIICTNSDTAGAPIHVLTLLTLLRNQFDFVAIFGEDGPIAARLRGMDIDVRIVPEMRSAVSPIRDLAAYRSIVTIIRQVKPSLIHCHSTKAGMLGRLVARRTSISCIYTVHGWGWRGMKLAKGSVIYFVERAMQIIHPKTTYIYVSRSVESDAKNWLKIPAPLGQVVQNGVVDVGLAPTVNREPVRILMVARVDRSKDHETLVQAFERLADPTELWLCGNGTDDAEFIAQTQIWAPERHVDIRHLGVRNDVDALLQNIDIFALISNFEALPLSIIEAMSAGKIVIATDVGGVKELITDHETGFLVDKNNVKGVATAIESAIDFEIRKTLGLAARKKFLQSFTDKKMTDKMSEIYQNLLPGN